MKTTPPENAGFDMRTLQNRVIRFGTLVTAVMGICGGCAVVVAKYNGWAEIPAKVDKGANMAATNQVQIDQLQRQFGDMMKAVQQNSKFEEECRNAATLNDHRLTRIEQKLDDMVDSQKEMREELRLKR